MVFSNDSHIDKSQNLYFKIFILTFTLIYLHFRYGFGRETSVELTGKTADEIYVEIAKAAN